MRRLHLQRLVKLCVQLAGLSALASAITLVILILSPRAQGLLVYVNWLNWPFVDLNRPTAAQRFFRGVCFPTRLLSIVVKKAQSSKEQGDAIVKAWHVLGTKRSPASTPPRKVTVLYCHGNTGNRAIWHRVETYNFLAQCGWDVVAMDYRGFGDSSWCVPTEMTLHEDTMSVIRHLEASHAVPSNIVLYGHSLGTAVVLGITEELSRAGSPPAGIILEAPFTNVADVVLPYMSRGLFKGRAPTFLRRFMHHKYPSLERAASGHITCPVLVLHGKQDKVVPYRHGVEIHTALISSRAAGILTSTDNSSSDNTEHSTGHRTADTGIAFLGLENAGHENGICCNEFKSAVRNFLLSL